MVKFAREINESGPDVIVYGMVPSSLVSLGQPSAKGGFLECLVRLMVAGTAERILALQ